MTTIAAVRDGARTWIGSDTMAKSCGTRLDSGPKWIRFGSWAVGIAGDMRTITLCREHSERLLRDLGGAFEFTNRFRGLLKEFDYDISPAAEQAVPNTMQDMLLASPDNLWSILCDLSIFPVERWTDGGGRAYGLGAMYAMRAVDDGERVLRTALEAGMTYNTGSGGEIWTDVLEA